MKRLLTIAVILICVCVVRAQEYTYSESEIYRSPLLKFLNNFSITVTTGYNSSKFKHELKGYYLLQSPDTLFITPNDGPFDPTAFPDAFRGWLNDPVLIDSVDVRDIYDVPYQRLDNPVGNPLLQQGLRSFNTDSLGIGFEGRGWGIPINISLRYNYDRIRVGAGFSMEFHSVKPLESTRSDLGIRNYEPNFKSTFFTRYYGQVGYRFYDWWDYSFAAEVEIGKNNLGGKFNKSVIDQGLYYNFGISIEKNLSEYFRFVVKPSYDIRSYTVNIPGGTGIKNTYNAFNLNFGVSITIPEIPRSPIKSDYVQLKHVITDPKTGRYMEVRGQPIWKKQNPKVGENHRKLWRYKNKNKKKLNPY